MTGSDLDRFATMSSAYVHIPFCSAVCPYCDFAVVAGADHLAARYTEAVVAEVAMSEPLPPLEAIYFGGGTPSHVDPALLGQMLEALSQRHGIAADSEISVEANPEDFGVGRAKALSSLGFNRVSFGAQSFDTGVLLALGRRHDGEAIGSAVTSAREAGFENISIDLIFGAVEETSASWEASLADVVDLDPSHVSCYALTVEPGTPLGRAVKAGGPGPDPDVQADRYEFADIALSSAGYERYEVSNWARPGRACRYNLVVWAQGEFEAYGNGAHRYRDGSRSHNVRRVEAYIQRVEAGTRPTAGAEAITGWDAEIDRLFVGLRRSAGVGPGPGIEAFRVSPGGRRLFQGGVVAMDSGRLVVKRPLLTDEAHRVVLDLRPPEGWGKSS